MSWGLGGGETASRLMERWLGFVNECKEVDEWLLRATQIFSCVDFYLDKHDSHESCAACAQLATTTSRSSHAILSNQERLNCV